MTDTTAIHGHHDAQSERHRPTFTYNESKNAGWVRNKAEYETLTGIATQVFDHHQKIGTPAGKREPTATHVEEIIGNDIDEGSQAITEGGNALHATLDEAQAHLTEAKAALESAAKFPGPVTTPESGTTYTGADGVKVVDTSSRKVEDDYASGKHHHDMVSATVRHMAEVLPYAEGAGLAAFLLFFLNVPLNDPLSDPLALISAVVLTVVAILAQYRTVHEGGARHNHAREARADGNRPEAEAAFTSRNRFLIVASVIAAAITAGLIWRTVITVGDDGGPIVLAILIFLALVVGIAMPVLGYWSIAFHGSKVSREIVALTKALETDKAEQDALKDDMQAHLDAAHECLALVIQRDVPNLLNDVQQQLLQVHLKYNFVRSQIGNLEQDPPKPGSRMLSGDDESGFKASMSTGIPGARDIDLQPLTDLLGRRQQLLTTHKELVVDLMDLPPHPWAGREA